MEQQSSSLSLAVLVEPIEKVRALLSKGISENEVKDPTTNATILCWVAQRKNDEEAAEIARILVDEHNVNPHEKDNMQQNCLFYAAREGLTELSKYFVSKGCNPNEQDKVGQTPLFYASRDGRTNCLRELLELGGNPNQLDNNRQSCLFYAARDGRYDTVKVLLEYGANASLKDSQRRTALTFAKGNGHTDIVDLLKLTLAHSRSNSGTHLTSALASLSSFSSSVAESGFAQTVMNSSIHPVGNIATSSLVSPASTRLECSVAVDQVSNSVLPSIVTAGTGLNEFVSNTERRSMKYEEGGNPSGLVSAAQVPLKNEDEAMDFACIRSSEAGKPPEGGSCRDSTSSKDSVLSGAFVSPSGTTSFGSQEGELFHANNCSGITNRIPSSATSASIAHLVSSPTAQNFHKRDASVLDNCPARSAMHRQKYRLQFHPPCEEQSLWMDAPLVKIEEFEKRFPNLAIWPKDRPMAEPKASADCFKREWRNAATTLMVNLSKYQGGHIFEKPVDPKRQHCPDYYDVISRPMSFSCIKNKLRRFEYESPADFLADVQLVFSNCALYNKEGSIVAITGKAMEQYFNNQVIVTKFSSYVERDKHIRRTLGLIEESGQVSEAPKTKDSNDEKVTASSSECSTKTLVTNFPPYAGENACPATASATQSTLVSLTTAESNSVKSLASVNANHASAALSDFSSGVTVATGDMGKDLKEAQHDTFSTPVSAGTVPSHFELSVEYSTTEVLTESTVCVPLISSDGEKNEELIYLAKGSEMNESENAGDTDGSSKNYSIEKRGERFSSEQIASDFRSSDSSNFSSNGRNYIVLTNGTDSKEVDVK